MPTKTSCRSSRRRLLLAAIAVAGNVSGCRSGPFRTPDARADEPFASGDGVGDGVGDGEIAADAVPVSADGDGTEAGSGDRTGYRRGTDRVDGHEDGRLEPVRDPAYDGTHVVADVLSNGCTRSSDFHVVHAVHDGACRLSLVRAREDLCRMATHVVRVAVPWTLPRGCDTGSLEFVNPGLEPVARQRGRRSPPED